MEKEDSIKIEEAVLNIRKLNAEYGSLALEMTKACNGNMYLMDLYVMATINRSENLVSAFCDLVEKKNFLVAVPVLRMQLDNLFRLRAAWLVDDINNFVMEVLGGTAISKLKDRNGNKMADWYLVDSLCKEYPVLKNIYEKSCGYVHFSDQHFFSTVKNMGPDAKMEMYIGNYSDNIPSKSYIDASSAFFQISGIMLSYIKGWIITKEGGALKSRGSSQISNSNSIGNV